MFTMKNFNSLYRTITFTIDESKSDPSQMFTAQWILADMTDAEIDEFFGYRPCLLDASGNVYKYLNPNDFTKDVDGNDVTNYINWTSGTYNVMIEYPRRWIKREKSGNIITVSITDNPADYDNGFHHYPRTRGAVDLTSEDTRTAEESGKRDYFYAGAYKGYVKDSKLRSISWFIPTTNQTRATFRTQAKANGTGYWLMGYFNRDYLKDIWWARFKNGNSQTALGRWFVDKTSWWSSTGCYTGSTNTRWMHWWNTSSWTDINNNRMKFAWQEDFWGNIWEWTDGLNINGYVAYASTDCSNFADDTTSGSYKNVGTCTSTSDSYITAMLWTTKGWYLPTAVGGSDSTKYCDNLWINSGARVAFSGAGWTDASKAGVFVWSLGNASSIASAFIGARLMFL